MTQPTIQCELNGEKFEATVSDKPWPKSCVGPDYYVVDGYVIVITLKGFEAFPIEPDSAI